MTGPHCKPGRPACLECRARHVRLLRFVLLTRCSNAAHWAAREGVPCYPPTEVDPRGTVCADRVRSAFENAEELGARADAHRRAEAARQRAEWRETLRDGRRQRTAEILNTIHRAAATPAAGTTHTDQTRSTS